MGDYFKSLLESPSNKLPVSPQPGYASNDILHAPISNDEIKTVLQSLKRNKAPGVEGLPPIAFKLFNNQLIQTLVSLFNKVLEDETYPEAWSTGIIKPIYKKGSKNDPKNYRGISLLPIMGKLFFAIMADRLTCWADLNNKLNEIKFGFKKNRRTSDAIFILHTAIQVAKNRRNHYSLALWILPRPLTLSTTIFCGQNCPQLV